MAEDERVQRYEGVRRLSLVLGCLGSLLTLLWLSAIGVERGGCELSRLVGREGCGGLKATDFDQRPLESVIASDAFQALPHEEQVHWVQVRVERGTVGQDPRYQALSKDLQRRFAENLIAKYHPSRMTRAATTWLVVVGLIGLSFLAPWGLVRVTAWVIKGFIADRSSGDRR
jgi:hypothetical protein